MKNFIQLENNGFIVKISLENLEYTEIPSIIYEIETENFNWKAFYTHDKLWFKDGSSHITCIALNHNENVIIFG